jgi:hypothetical protein
MLPNTGQINARIKVTFYVILYYVIRVYGLDSFVKLWKDRFSLVNKWFVAIEDIFNFDRTNRNL